MMYKETLYFWKYINFKTFYIQQGIAIISILKRNNYYSI